MDLNERERESTHDEFPILFVLRQANKRVFCRPCHSLPFFFDFTELDKLSRPLTGDVHMHESTHTHTHNSPLRLTKTLQKKHTSIYLFSFLYVFQLAKGLIRDDGKQFSNEQGEMFAAQWHQHLANSVSRPTTEKATTRW